MFLLYNLAEWERFELSMSLYISMTYEGTVSRSCLPWRGGCRDARGDQAGFGGFDRFCAQIDDSTVAESLAASFRASRLALRASKGIMYI